MSQNLWENNFLQIGVLSFICSFISLMIFQKSQLILNLFTSLINRLFSPDFASKLQILTIESQQLIGIVIVLLITDIILWISTLASKFSSLELMVSLSLVITTSWLVFQIIKQTFDIYLLETAVEKGKKVNSELLIIGKYVANLLAIILIIIVFAETHEINVFGLIASLGVGGIAVAFAAQKILEQILGGVVIYLDQPFVVDDYIGLPDGTFGRVESIGLRSTKIRTSGKGTIMIVPNNSLIQTNIENFTGAKKVMAIINLTFHQVINQEEQALIRQIIIDSTNNIFGLDSRNTDVNFREISNGTENLQTQAQITFFILGSGEVSFELRRQLLDVAAQTMATKLHEYELGFKIEEPTIYIDAPITI